MGEALRHLTLDVPYRTGPLSWTDPDAGGVFFYVVYRECLRFSAGDQVRRWCEVIDDSRPPQLFRLFVETTDVVGSYRVNERGYLKCVFPDLELTGLPCEQAPELLVFHASRARLGVSFSFVYTRGAAEAEPSDGL